MKDSNTELDAITYLLKKTEWPQPSSSLAYRIQQAALNQNVHVTAYPSGPALFSAHPTLPFLAVTLALFLGIASGFVTSHDAKAYSPYGSYYYATQDISILGMYQSQTQNPTE